MGKTSQGPPILVSSIPFQILDPITAFEPYSSFWSLILLYFHHFLVREAMLGEGVLCNMPALTARPWKIITFDLN